MNDALSQVAPIKCAKCNKPMSLPLVCDYCHTLNAAATTTDYFTLLGLPRRFDIDDRVLQKKYLSLSRYAHPDFCANEEQEVQGLHEQVSAALNDAYRTLKDPASRAAYLLELLGGKSSAEDKSVPDGFLGTMMMMQEEIADARAAGNKDELRRLHSVLETQHDGLLKRLAELFEDHQQAVVCEAVRADLMAEIRRKVNAVSYVKKLLDLAE